MIDWEGKAYDFILTRKKYSIKWKQKWTDYKKWGDFGGKWKAKAEVDYTEDELLKEITEPCYKFLWWKVESGVPGSGGGGVGGGGGGGGGNENGWRCNMSFVESVNVFDMLFYPVNGGSMGSNIFFNNDGTKFYCFSLSGYLIQFELDEPFVLSSIRYVNAVYIHDMIAAYVGLNNGYFIFTYFISPDGQYLYAANTNYVGQFKFLTPWDITSLIYTGKKYTLPEYPGADVTFYFICLSGDGSKLYACQSYSGHFFQCYLSTPWDISTIYDIDEISNNFYDVISFKPDGSMLFLHVFGGYIPYVLTTPWDVKSALQMAPCIFYDTNFLGPVYYAFGCFSNNGLYYFVMSDNYTIYKFAVNS
jgi:hypothetical protein